MSCPVCGKEARTYIYYCSKYAVYVQKKCWQKHIATAHKEK